MLISDMTCSGFGGARQIAGVQGGGSPIMETIAILSNYNLKEKARFANFLAGIDVVGKPDGKVVFEGERANLEKFKHSLEIFEKSA